MEPIINTEYQQIKVSSDEKLLKRRAAPQTVRILNKEFDEYMEMYNTSVQMNIENSDWLYDRIPENLEGKLEYKDLTWDFMFAAYYRLGMIAAVSEKVKNILEELFLEYYICLDRQKCMYIHWHLILAKFRNHYRFQ